MEALFIALFIWVILQKKRFGSLKSFDNTRGITKLLINRDSKQLRFCITSQIKMNTDI